jgi:hypothetical protein
MCPFDPSFLICKVKELDDIISKALFSLPGTEGNRKPNRQQIRSLSITRWLVSQAPVFILNKCA